MKTIVYFCLLSICFYACSINPTTSIEGHWKLEGKKTGTSNEVIPAEENIYFMFKDSTCLFYSSTLFDDDEKWKPLGQRFKLDTEKEKLYIMLRDLNAVQDEYTYSFASRNELHLSFYLIPDQQKHPITYILKREK